MTKQTLASEIASWLISKGWPDKPILQDDMVTSVTSFRYADLGKFGLNCTILSNEEDGGMLTLVASPDFSIQESSIAEVKTFCSHFRKEYGNFYISDDGNINYIHSRSVDSFLNGLDDVVGEIEIMVNEMDDYVAKLSLSIVDVANGKSAAKAIESLQADN
jgi:hypothetical protein